MKTKDLYKENKETTKDIWYSNHDEYSIFSNLAPRKFKYQGTEFVSVEHAYQVLKSGTFDWETHRKYKAATPGRKIMGKYPANRNTNLMLMKDLIWQSLQQNPEVLEKLKNTRNIRLTHEKDKCMWGEEFPKILMKLRRHAISADFK